METSGITALNDLQLSTDIFAVKYYRLIWSCITACTGGWSGARRYCINGDGWLLPTPTSL